jgi:amino acid transporter
MMAAPDDGAVTFPSSSHDAEPPLPRVLGLFDAVLLVVGGIIGSGIFFKAKVLAEGELHSFGPIIGAWIAVGVHTLLGTLSLAELAAMLPQTGAGTILIAAGIIYYTWAQRRRARMSTETEGPDLLHSSRRDL